MAILKFRPWKAAKIPLCFPFFFLLCKKRSWKRHDLLEKFEWGWAQSYFLALSERTFWTKSQLRTSSGNILFRRHVWLCPKFCCCANRNWDSLTRTTDEVVEHRIKQLYDRYKNKAVAIQDLLSGLSFHALHKKHTIQFFPHTLFHSQSREQKHVL